MRSLTLFSAPKAFTDPSIDTIQTNALLSWSKLPGVEIILMGDEEGISEAATRIGALHVADVRRNEKGTPLVSSMIHLARDRGSGTLLGIINSDMIIMQDLLNAVTTVSTGPREFVLMGRRWDVAIDDRMDFSEGWEDRLRTRVRQAGELHRPAGSDFFLFPRNCYEDVPDFAVGRAGWDNWMIYEARRKRWTVVDCTPSVTVIHQNHDYGHLPGGVPHYSMPETNENIRLAGGDASIRYTVLDATHCLINGRLIRAPMSFPRLRRKVELLLRTLFFFLPSDLVEEFARPKRWKKRFLRLLGKHPGETNGPGATTIR
jgi:hypothetical protein